MDPKITVTFSNGKRRALKSPEEFSSINKDRKAVFVMRNLQVYEGYSDGEVDVEGDFGIWETTLHGIALPFEMLMGWFYKNSRKK